MSNEISKKATMALSDLSSNGGLLNEEQQDTFIRDLIDQPTIMRVARVVPMSGPTMEINKIGFGSRILAAATQTQSSRALSEGNRTQATTSKVTLNTVEVIAEIRLPYEVLEDNIERGSMEDTILALIAERAALDLEELIIQGDENSGDDYLALLDGIIILTTSNVVNASSASITPTIFSNVIKALPTRFRRNRATMRYFVPMDVEQDYRLNVAGRGSDLGDQVLTGRAALPVFGVPIDGVALMPAANMIFTNPQNIVVGIQRNIRLETDRDITTREIIIVVTARIDVVMEDEEAAVKVINLA